MGELALTGGKKLYDKSIYTTWPIVGKGDADGLLTVLGRTEQGRGGPAAAAFAERFARYNGVRHCIPCANGTVSLELILRALGIGRGDEVIIPPYTFVATVSSIIYAGATPVFADVDDTCSLSAAGVREKITPKTKAFIPVYVGGRPADLDALEALSTETGIAMIGDAAQAVGSAWRGRPIGSYGVAASFSCQNSKNLTCGEGGIITTDSDALAAGIRAILAGGADGSGAYTGIGINHNLSEWQASILNSQMDGLDAQIARRMDNAACLDSLLEPLPFIAPLRADERITVNSYHLYLVRIDESRLGGVTRDRFLEAVQAEGIDLVAGYLPLYDFPCLSSRYVKKALADEVDIRPQTPTADHLARHEAAWLYHSLLLNDRDVIRHIADGIQKVYEHLDELR